MDEIGAIILAAGESSRLGYPKQFLLHHEKTLIERAVEAAELCRPIVVIGGRDYAKVAEVLKGSPAIIIENTEWESGIGTSIRRGVDEALGLSPELNALLLMVCDQPFVTPDLIATLIERRIRSNRSIIACRYSDTLGVPAIFDRSLFPRLRSLPDDSGAKRIIQSNRENVEGVDFPGGEIDIDTETDRESYLRGG